IKTGGLLPRDFWTEDGRNFSLQSRFGAQPDRNPLGGQTLANKGIVPKGPFNKSFWDRKKGQWVDEIDGEQVVLNYKEHAGRIKSLEYRSRSIKNVDKSYKFRFSIPSKFKQDLIEKASICINGISLTISKILPTSFEIWVIPHTYKLTNLSKLKKNSLVNIEIDILSKYVKNYFNAKK
ncbi:MAG: hypothetical protein EBY54_04670, partial [Proteobacteria bacterium]|nr:hypothetical protein [Pseudomonadota bacterium]